MKTRYILSALFLFMGFVSCNEDKLNPANPNQLGIETFYRTGPQLEAAVNAVYSSIQANNLYNREYFFLQDLLSDDCQSGGPQLEAQRAQVLNHVFDASNSVINSNWRGWYRVVHRANLVLENADNAVDEITEDLRNRVIGEAYFLRALANFELVSLWGPIPLMTSSATSPDGLQRSPENEVYNIIFSDLQEAINRLPLKSAYSGESVGRATKGAAQALAAKAHLFRADFAAARPFLLEVINSGEYTLVDRYMDNFEEENENNNESVWEVQFSEEFGNAGGWNGDGSNIAEVTFRGQEYGPTAWRNVIPSESLVNEFETVENGAAKDDPRGSYNFYRIGDSYNNGQSVLTEEKVQGDTESPSWRKYQMIYKRENEDVQSGINFRVIRYADVLLMMAEVENELAGPAAALPYINSTRERADVDMPLYPTNLYPTGSKEEMRLAIMHERRVELAGEQIRNRDIRRWRRQGVLPSEPINGFQDKNDLLPIPLVEIDNNSALSNADQNTGY
ncbi:RagB/SusD family nutrient uptake outer membrane protein [Cyclobacterium sp. 1_MG-2023]|uniref:RagB/SusD family nutrient uptake outer membrane protein n=1 Tax=Cyclobacterium sp. 1_MG-2023 TaxID=3062681 RepID=UPI0026E3BBA9|nr:RagB/SusD family nutrient uptake outer membrane protein [Cyclobacterium sp. 1_MG-2023]MDO6440300.1 RagB/SusD family nutrient uptake outer membrane protein [Cyclobacterium sp. 1_MG-2023]